MTTYTTKQNAVRGYSAEVSEQVYDWLEANDKFDLITMLLEKMSNEEVDEIVADIERCEADNAEFGEDA